MNSYLVTEGPVDAAILGPILRSLGLTSVEVRSAGGRAFITSLARSIALLKRAHVAVVADADTTKPSRIREQQIDFEDLTRGPTVGGCRLFLAIPTLEDELFPTAADFTAVVGADLTPAELQHLTADRHGFIRSWAGVNAAKIVIDPARARERLENSNLRGLLAYLRQDIEAAA